MAFMADLCFMGMVGLLIPGVGLAIAMFVLGAHYLIGLIIVVYFWGKTHGLLPKALLVWGWIVPLPALTIGLILTIIASNKIGETLLEAGALLVETVVIQGIAIGTGGAGEALELGAVAAEGVEVGAEVAEVGATAAEGVAAAGEAVGAGEAAGTAGEVGAGVGEAGTEAGEGAAQAGGGVDLEPEEEKNPIENLGRDLDQPQENEFREGSQTQATEAEEEEDAERARRKKTAERIKKGIHLVTSEDEENEEENIDEPPRRVDESEDEELEDAA